MTRKPALGLWMCTALVVGSMVGSGVFLLPASLSPYGGISILGWLVSAGGAMCLALVMARLGALIPKVGGPYAFAREGFGDFIGFWVAWSYWISLLTANAALAVATVSYATVFWPALGASPVAGGIGALVALWGLTVVNASGVRAAGQVQVVTTVLKLLPLAAIGTIGFLYFEPAHFRPFNPTGGSPLTAVTATVTLTLWAFMGLEAATVPAADVHEPARTIPRATILGTGIAAVIFILSTSGVMGIIAPADLAVSTAPFADAAGSIWGEGGRLVIGAGATIACFGALNGWIMLSGQLPRAAAQDGLLPAAFARLTPRGTPAFGLIFAASVATVLIGMNYTRGLVQAFTFLILLSTLATLLAYVFASATGLLFALRERRAARRPARAGRAAGVAAPVRRMAVATLAFGFSLWAIAGAGPETVFWGFLLLVAGVPVFVLMRARTSRAEDGERPG